MGVRDDSGGRDRPDALDDALHRVFGAALDLSSALRYVDDQRAVAHIRAATALLDLVTRDLRIAALDRIPGERHVAEPGASLFITFHDRER